MCGVSTVVMYVDDGTEAGIFGIAYYLGHAVEPCGLDGVAWCGTEFSEPCHRNAHRFDAGFGEFVEQLLRGGRVAPCCFGCRAVVVGVELVAEVPAKAEKCCILNGTVGVRYYRRFHIVRNFACSLFYGGVGFELAGGEGYGRTALGSVVGSYCEDESGYVAFASRRLARDPRLCRICSGYTARFYSNGDFSACFTDILRCAFYAEIRFGGVGGWDGSGNGGVFRTCPQGTCGKQCREYVSCYVFHFFDGALLYMFSSVIVLSVRL